MKKISPAQKRFLRKKNKEKRTWLQSLGRSTFSNAKVPKVTSKSISEAVTLLERREMERDFFKFTNRYFGYGIISIPTPYFLTGATS